MAVHYETLQPDDGFPSCPWHRRVLRVSGGTAGNRRVSALSGISRANRTVTVGPSCHLFKANHKTVPFPPSTTPPQPPSRFESR